MSFWNNLFNDKFHQEQEWVAENKEHVDKLLDTVESAPKDSTEYKQAVGQLNQEGWLGEDEDNTMKGILKWFN